MRTLPDTVNSAVKSLLCPKVKLPHMQREIYNPSCLSFCTDLCGSRYKHNFWFAILCGYCSRCKRACNLNHTGCSRGNLPDNMLHCPTSEPVLSKATLNYVSFETRSVETYGKGVPFTTMEKVVTPTEYFEFLRKFRLVSNQL